MIAFIKSLFGGEKAMEEHNFTTEIDEMSDAFIYSLNLDEQDMHPGSHG